MQKTSNIFNQEIQIILDNVEHSLNSQNKLLLHKEVDNKQ